MPPIYILSENELLALSSVVIQNSYIYGKTKSQSNSLVTHSYRAHVNIRYDYLRNQELDASDV